MNAMLWVLIDMIFVCFAIVVGGVKGVDITDSLLVFIAIKLSIMSNRLPN